MNNNALVVVEMLHEVNLHAHISANPSPQNGHRSTIRIFEIQHRSSKQDLKAMHHNFSMNQTHLELGKQSFCNIIILPTNKKLLLCNK